MDVTDPRIAVPLTIAIIVFAIVTIINYKKYVENKEEKIEKPKPKVKHPLYRFVFKVTYRNGDVENFDLQCVKEPQFSDNGVIYIYQNQEVDYRYSILCTDVRKMEFSKTEI